jgi:hypothetical protein
MSNLEPRAALQLLADLARDCRNGWSIGSFGAIGEFVCSGQEPAAIEVSAAKVEIKTARGGIQIAPLVPMRAIAYDTLSADGDGWSHALALCAPQDQGRQGRIAALGRDAAALQPEQRDAELFDLGVAAGSIRMCVRTHDKGLADALTANAGRELLSNRELLNRILSVQPHRVMLSSAGRIEVYQPIPSADQTSPSGPHTHLLPKLISARRTHSANVPVPRGWQPVLTVHPRSPWHNADNARVPYDEAADSAFAPMLKRFGLPEDKEVRDSITRAVRSGADPAGFPWPATRRGRAAARITLRRLAAAQTGTAASWRAIRDNTPVEVDTDFGA